VIPGKMKLNTITDPYSGDETSLRRASLHLAVLTDNLRGMFPKKIHYPKGFQFLETASPIHSVSWHGWFSVPRLLDANGMTNHIKALLSGGGEALFDQYLFWIDITKRFLGGNVHEIIRSKELFRDPDSRTNSHGMIGQLSTKEEAAGKVRVFALVDP